MQLYINRKQNRYCTTNFPALSNSIETIYVGTQKHNDVNK